MFPLKKTFTYAIIGASKNREKYGNIVLRNLVASEFQCVPINPNEKEIENIQTYSSLHTVPFKIDVVIFVVPPHITEKVLQDVANLGISKVWLQPGSSSELAITFCKNNNIELIHDICIMMHK